ncbi:RNA polymerase subunit sigma-54 [Collibacillus ludicampi]|uniref:HTH-type transcriptional regulatory protein TyrR n=1 Tax=Collibacillus ludicampi TaxID=2771369 RepID=A0AAV4LH86_9BACL|nr:sigma 54-interacting transcriptional regulator [Collibacillus ludicampi]GIM46869.1 RNA polymerase subunit sigma-54 [Collibacillus ludicampi]
MTVHPEKEWNEAEAILHSLQDDIMVTNVDGVILRTSETTGKIYGVETDELIGKSVYELEKEGLFTPIVTPMVLKEKKKVTCIQTTKRGKKLIVTGIPVFNPQGELVRIVSYSHDITELMNLKEYLRAMEEDMERVKSELIMLRDKHAFADGIIANSASMKKVLDVSTRVAEVDVNVLLLGESGVGKSHLAKFIHNRSPRCKGPFIEVNCGAIPDSLFEAEFFGYEAGAFTGASRHGKIGLAELAEGGTLFLDEIGELSILNQVKLLKFIQEKRFYRVGGTKIREVDFRLIAATNQDLTTAIKEKKFREDLYFRLNVVPITVPPLRERPEDILPLIEYFLKYFSEKYNRTKTLDGAVIQKLVYYTWTGNVRELMNVIEQLVVMSSSSLITVENLPSHIRAPYDSLSFGEEDHRTLPEILANVERQVLTRARKRYKTTFEIAKALGISQPSVVRKMKKHKIK